MDNKLKTYLQTGSITLSELKELVHYYGWAEDTSFEESILPEGGAVILEHIWSGNMEHVRPLITIDSEGMITSTGDLEAVKRLQKQHVTVSF